MNKDQEYHWNKERQDIIAGAGVGIGLLFFILAVLSVIFLSTAILPIAFVVFSVLGFCMTTEKEYRVRDCLAYAGIGGIFIATILFIKL